MYEHQIVRKWTRAALLLIFFAAAAAMHMKTTDDRDRTVPTGTSQQLKMQALVTGEGPPLALVGGGLTGWKSWEPHARRLSPTRSVARLQPLNVQYGLENRPLPETYSVRLESAALAAALDDLDWDDPLDLAAWSYGAVIALDFALDHPERIRTLTLIEPPAGWVLPPGALDDEQLQALRSIRMDHDITGDDLERFLHTAGLLPPGADPRNLPQWPVWMEHRRSLRGGLDPFAHEDDTERLRSFDRPVLLVSGTGSAGYYRLILERLADFLPRAHLIEMPSGHAPHIVSIDRFLAELTLFFESAGDIFHRVTSSDGTTISYRQRGEGPPLLFVHGTTADHRSWTGFSRHLEQHLTIYAMDRRGRGGSGDASTYDFAREVEDLAAVVTAIGTPLTLFGHSFGGLVSLEAALRSEHIQRMVLYEPAIPTGVSPVPPDILERIQRHVDSGEPERAMELFLREVAEIPEDELDLYRRSPLWTARIPLAATIARELTAEASYVFDQDGFKHLRVPTLLLLGGDSPALYREGIERVEAALPNSEIVILPDQQHMAHHTNPELLAEELLRFLEE